MREYVAGKPQLIARKGTRDLISRMKDPHGWNRDDVGNLRETWPVPGMGIVGERFRNARERAGLSQRRLAIYSGVSQSAISRLERGLSGGMRVEALIRIATAIGSRFPFGFCPHEHRCPYPYDPRGKVYIDLG